MHFPQVFSFALGCSRQSLAADVSSSILSLKLPALLLADAMFPGLGRLELVRMNVAGCSTALRRRSVAEILVAALLPVRARSVDPFVRFCRVGVYLRRLAWCFLLSSVSPLAVCRSMGRNEKLPLVLNHQL